METGIYILITSDGYRVNYSNQYLNLFGNYDDKTNNFAIDTKVLYNMFNDCFVFQTNYDALAEAKSISTKHKETDNGIMEIKYSRYTFEELLNDVNKTNT